MSLVQHKETVFQATDGTAIGLTLSSSPVNGNHLHLFLGIAAGVLDIASVVQTGVTWTHVGGHLSASGVSIDEYLGAVGSGASASLTLNLTAPTEGGLCVIEWNGESASPLDKTAYNDDINSGIVDPADSGTTAVTSQANEVVFAAWAIAPSDQYQLTSIPHMLTWYDPSPNYLVNLYVGYREVTSTGAQNEEIDSAVNGGSFYSAKISTFKVSTGQTYNVSEAESGSAADSPSATKGQSATEAETGAASETESAIRTQTATTTETASAGDSPSCSMDSPQTGSESSSAVDTEDASRGQNVARNEGQPDINATVNQSATRTQAASVSESGNAVDTEITGGTIYSDMVTEAGAGTETESAQVDFQASSAEVGSADDVTDASVVSIPLPSGAYGGLKLHKQLRASLRERLHPVDVSDAEVVHQIDETRLPAYIRAQQLREDSEIVTLLSVMEGFDGVPIDTIGDTMVAVKRVRSKLFPIPSDKDRQRMENRLKRKLRTYFRESLERYRNA